MSTLLLDRNAIKKLIQMSDVIKMVEEAFRMRGGGRGKMPAKTYRLLSMVISGQCLLLCPGVPMLNE